MVLMDDATERPPFTLHDIEQAAERIAPFAVRTPLLENPALNERVGRRVLIKPELFQRMGSFKFRGAYNALASLPQVVRWRGVVAFSSGNHAQGVAAAARLFGVPAVIVMPADAPAAKIEATRALGAEIRPYDRWSEDREAIGRALSEERGATLIPPFDDLAVMAGQGTVGLEMATDAAALGVPLGDVLVPCSGGGLVAGTATAIKAKSPHTRVHAVEPAGFDDTARSLEAGYLCSNDPAARSICDALMVAQPGALTFAVNRHVLSGGLVVSDAEVLEAIAYAARTLKLVVEPGGAVGLAALLSSRLPTGDGAVGLVLSGGNIDPQILQAAFAR